jgi:glutamate-1-semialdehyde aminotransferase
MPSAAATMTAVVRAGSIPSLRLSTAGSQAPASGIRMARGSSMRPFGTEA